MHKNTDRTTKGTKPQHPDIQKRDKKYQERHKKIITKKTFNKQLNKIIT